jgi:hypothetical protein
MRAVRLWNKWFHPSLFSVFKAMEITMYQRTKFDLSGSLEAYDPDSYTSGLSDYDVAVLRCRTGLPAIAIRRATMKVGPDLKKIEQELTAQKTNRD